MLIGYNNDVEYRGKQFHIQTEDHGTGTAKIESQLFHSGQILDTKFVDYEDLLEEAPESEHDKKIEERMRSVHVGLYQKLLNGEYDEMVGLEPVEDPEAVEAPEPDEFTPAQERVPAAAAKVEEGGQDALEDFHEQEANKHSDLDSLKEKLGDADDSEEAPSDDVISDPEISLGGEPEAEVATAGAEASGKTSSAADEETARESSDDDAAQAGDSSGDAASLRDQIARSSEETRADGEAPTKPDELPTTGEEAWDGCDPPRDELAIDELVEAEIQ